MEERREPCEAHLLGTPCVCVCVCMLLLGGGEDRLSHSQLGGGVMALPGNLPLSHSPQTKEQGKASPMRKTIESWNVGNKQNHRSVSLHPSSGEAKAQTGSGPELNMETVVFP